ncbi:hypothetical protein SESBI_07957 [Sesbania bispinosa]|nr:hypothetical protein SESBI_07957 [Sesbania bispinosa]
METKIGCKVCVTGAAGYIGSWLVKKLLAKGYIVHATLRDLNIYNPTEFEPAIKGCEFVFHVATPFNHEVGSQQYKDIVEANSCGVKSIAMSCVRSGTVRRLIYTGSVVSGFSTER